MWMINNRTPYAAERTWVRDKHGAHHWVVAVRATFSVGERGALTLSETQIPPLHEAIFYGEPGVSSLQYEADLGHMKPATDVTVVGSAYAPGGRPVRSVMASLRLQNLRKTIEVFGDRVYFLGPLGVGISDPVPFMKQPIRYEKAYGGADTTDPNPARHLRDARNPIGCGTARNARTLVGQPAHSIEYPGIAPVKTGPAGFGPIASHWSPRREYAGTYDEHWQAAKKPLLADDYDVRFTLCAPRDQQTGGYLHGGEVLELENLSPGGILRLTLPKIYLTFATRFGSRIEEHRARMASVVVEPDDSRLAIVWQTSLLVSARDADYLDETVVDEKPYLT